MCGFETKDLQKQNTNYSFINMGMAIWMCVPFGLSYISHFINEGDVIIHSPEYQNFQYQTDIEYHTWRSLEMSYHMLNYIDCNNFDLFNGYSSCAHSKLYGTASDNTPCKLIDKNTTDYTPVVNQNQKIYTPYKAIYVSDKTIAKTDFERINYYYDMIKKTGAKMYYGCAPIDYEACTVVSVSGYDENVRQNCSATPFCSIENYMFNTDYFYDLYYHLQPRYRHIYMEQLVFDLNKQLGADGFKTLTYIWTN